ncbi:MAG: Crp/Fnr family transcriptional regulator [Brevundimonas sp.]
MQTSLAMTPQTMTEPMARPATLRLWSAFAPLDMDVRARALRSGRVDAADRGDAFEAQGEVAVVLGGCLLLTVGRSPLCAGVAGAGDLVDLGSGASGRWITAGEIYCVTLKTFLEDAGDAGLRFLLLAAERRRQASDARLACAMAQPAVTRVASLLLEIDAACDGPDVPLCQSDIAAMLALRRTSVNAACQALRRAGVIRTRRGRTIILDREELAQAACGAAALDSLQDRATNAVSAA